jgi:hypothetical protein
MFETSVFNESCKGSATEEPQRARLAQGLFGARSAAPCGDRTFMFGAAHQRSERLQAKSSASFTART